MFFSVDIDLVYILVNFSKMQKKRLNNLNDYTMFFFCRDTLSISIQKRTNNNTYISGYINYFSFSYFKWNENLSKPNNYLNLELFLSRINRCSD